MVLFPPGENCRYAIVYSGRSRLPAPLNNLYAENSDCKIKSDSIFKKNVFFKENVCRKADLIDFLIFSRKKRDFFTGLAIQAEHDKSRLQNLRGFAEESSDRRRIPAGPVGNGETSGRAAEEIRQRPEPLFCFCADGKQNAGTYVYAVWPCHEQR